MLSNIKTAKERQTIINSTKPSSYINPIFQQSSVLINHFEKTLKNWTNAPNPTDKEITIPITTSIPVAKYEEWEKIFKGSGYKVYMDKYRFTLSMPNASDD